MTTSPDYRKPRTAYKPSHGQVNMSINAPCVSYDEVQALVLAIPDVGNVHLVTASLRLSRFVYSYLLDLCEGSIKATRVRAQLLKDETLDMEYDASLPVRQRRFWFYVLNELIRAGVVLPVVERGMVVKGEQEVAA